MSDSRTAVGYIRVSTDKQADHGVSLDAQRKRIEMYCALHDLELLDILEDTGSAKSIEGRPSMRNLIRMARAGAVDAVITCKLDRMFRNTVEAITIIPELQGLGCATHILDLGGVSLDTSTPMGGFFLTMAAAFSELERKQIAERTRTALRHKRDSGKLYSAHAPYGWQHEGGSQVKHAAEQQTVVVIMSNHVLGVPAARIAKILNESNMPTRGRVVQMVGVGKSLRNAPRWHASTVRNIIEHELNQPLLERLRAKSASHAEHGMPACSGEAKGG